MGSAIARTDRWTCGWAADGPSAADLVNELSEPELADLIFEYGGEHRSRRIARAIVRKRPITTTDQLAGVIAGALGKRPGGPTPRVAPSKRSVSRSTGSSMSSPLPCLERSNSSLPVAAWS